MNDMNMNILNYFSDNNNNFYNLEHFKNYKINIINDDYTKLKKYKNKSISLASRNELNQKYYNDIIEKCNVGIFITCINKSHIIAFIIGRFNKINTKLIIELLGSANLNNNKNSPSFGQFLINKLLFVLNPSEFIINDVHKHMINYYLHIGFIIKAYTINNTYILSINDNINTYLTKTNLHIFYKMLIYTKNFTP